jgi:putative ABC transport system substrate-binding protein
VTSRRAFLGTLTGGLLAVPALAQGQQSIKPYQVGVLTPARVDLGSPQIDALRQGLKELGWLEGRDLVLVLRSAEGNPERLPALASELAEMPVDIIVAGATQASLAAKGATGRIPIVSVYTFDPVEAGLVASLARPGGNVTGLSAMASEYVGKMLQVLKEAAPRADRIAVLGDPGNPSYVTYWRERYVVRLESAPSR